MVRYPEVSVLLVGQDGNAFSIVARVCGALRNHGVSREVIAEFTQNATAGDYDHLLRTVMTWVSFDIQDEEDEDEEWNRDHCGWCEELHYDCECVG
jgi:hypothetical protein